VGCVVVVVVMSLREKIMHTILGDWPVVVKFVGRVMVREWYTIGCEEGLLPTISKKYNRTFWSRCLKRGALLPPHSLSTGPE
jgi:hypothetical protein